MSTDAVSLPAVSRRPRLAAQPWLGLGGLLLTAVFFIALRGWPTNTITRRSRRLLAGNTLVIGLGAVTYAVLHDAAGLAPGAIGAVCGCVITAALVVAMLIGIMLHVDIGLRWPFAGLRRDAVAQRLSDDLHPALRPELGEDAGN
jgi:hypothetical protein